MRQIFENGKRGKINMIDHISVYGSLENARQNMAMKAFAREVLLEENYEKFIKSYKFMFWFQLLGVLAGFLVPSVLLVVIMQDMAYAAFGAAIGIIWMIIWMLISLVIPQGRIYRNFSKWFRKRHAKINELDAIFYE